MANRRPPLIIDSNILLMSFGNSWPYRRWNCMAPPLLWTEITSALHEAVWRQEVSASTADSMRGAIRRLPISVEQPEALHDTAWEIADELGLAKTYDAEYLALARIRGALLVTADARLRRSADRLGFVVDPVELITR